MDDELDDFRSGKLQFRDKWQFELKTELFPLLKKEKNIQIQEFYLFIPNSLQINQETYPKSQFYQDQTNLIRYKTPEFNLKEILNPLNKKSPLIRLKHLFLEKHAKKNEMINNEFKILANIFHGTLRNGILRFYHQFDIHHSDQGSLNNEIEEFITSIKEFILSYRIFRSEKEIASIITAFDYIDEFISLNINDYLTHFLSRLRAKQDHALSHIDKQISDLLVEEKFYREKRFKECIDMPSESPSEEYLFYRKGLLHKFVIDPLLLKTSRASVSERYRGFILGIPAGVAMLIYLLLFLWQGNVFLINSEPFIILTVILYILKDRLKEDLRNLSYRQAAKFFSDYTTEILSPSHGQILGTLKEYMAFVKEKNIPGEILQAREKEFANMLEAFKRPEHIIYYKKTIKTKANKLEKRFHGISNIFRFDIHHFLAKAEDPYQTNLSIDPNTLEIIRRQLPRVYHINIIIKNTLLFPNHSKQVQVNKYRLIIDKNGIKRIEYLE